MPRRWPDILPLASEPGFGLSPVDQTLRTDMEVGMARVRPLSLARNDLVDLQWIFSDLEMGHWRAWWEDAAWSISGDSDSLATYTPTTASITVDSVVGPEGDHLADRIVEDTTTATHFVQDTFGSEATASATILCRATLKAAGRNFARLTFIDRAGASAIVTVDLTAGTIFSTSATLSASIESRGNGWWRVTLTAGISSGVATPRFRIQPMQTGTTASYLGDGVSGIDVCEQQARVVTGVDGFLRTDATGKVQGAARNAAWVFLPVAVGGGFRYLEARFKGTFKAAMKQGGIWDVAAQVEVR